MSQHTEQHQIAVASCHMLEVVVIQIKGLVVLVLDGQEVLEAARALEEVEEFLDHLAGGGRGLRSRLG